MKAKAFNTKTQRHKGTKKFFIALRLCAFVLGIFLAACETVEPATLTPTWALSGPTVAASPTVDPLPIFPTPVPGENYFEGNVIQQTAAALAPDSAIPPIIVEGTIQPDDIFRPFNEVVLTASDGTMLFGDLYQEPTQRRPGILLLATNRLDWGDFPLRLFNAGFTVLAMDIRSDPALMSDDFAVMLGSMGNGIANPNRLAVIGAAEGADMALLGCAAELPEDSLCDAAALISPLDLETLLPLMGTYGARPLLLAVSENDAQAFGTATALEAAAQGEVLFQPFDSEGRGTAILQSRADMGDLLIAWLQRLLIG